MKFSTQVFLVGLLAVGWVSSTPTQHLQVEEHKLKGIIDGLINDTINALLANVTDPITIETLSLNFTEDLLNGEANISSFQLYGIKKLVATSIDVTLTNLSMKAIIQIPQIILNTKYYADIVLANLIPLYGDGRIGVTIDDTELLVGGKVSITGGLRISNVTVSISVGDVVFALDGLLNNPAFSTLVTEVLNDVVAPFINDNQEVISGIISPIAQEVINLLLSGNNSDALFEEVDAAIQLANLE